MSPRDVLVARAGLLARTRRFFDAQGFVEVVTPTLVRAPAAELWIDAFAVTDPEGEKWLAPSPELQMKRLLVRQSGPIYQITRSYRHGERGRLHRPEFSMLEWYRPGADYRAAMADAVALLRAMAGGPSVRFRGATIELPADLEGAERLTVREAFERFARHAPPDDPDVFTREIGEQVEPNLGIARPTVLYDYPRHQASLARTSSADEAIAERFELYVAGIELCNGFSELCDPVEQRARFSATNDARSVHGKPRYPVDEAFLEDLGRLGAAAGVAWGVDRTVMLLCDAPDLASVLPGWE